MEDLLRSFWGFGGNFQELSPNFSKVAFMGNQQTQRILGQLLRSLLQNPQNFSQVAPEVRPAVHVALLCLISTRFLGTETTEKSPKIPRHFSTPNTQASPKKKSTKVFRRANKVTKQGQCMGQAKPSKCSQVQIHTNWVAL